MPKHLTNALLLGLGLLLPATLLAAPQNDPVVARYHFAGSTAVLADTNLAQLKKVSALSQTAAFQDLLEQKVASLLASSFGKQLNPSVDSEPLLRPLIDDLVKSESVAVFGGRSNAPLGFVLAIRLDEARYAAWQNGFSRLISGTPDRVQSEGFTGSAWKKQSIQLIRAKDWVVISRGEDLKTQSVEFLRGIAQQGRPAAALRGDFLEGDADWPKLQVWLPLASSPFKLARTQFSVGAKGENLRTTVRVRYPEIFQWKSKPWRVPTELVHDPLISFTAVQSPAPFLKPNPWLSRLKVNPWNEEFFIWGVQGVPFMTYGAVAVDHATNAFTELATQMPAVFNSKLKELRSGEFQLSTNRTEITWSGLPFMVPSMRATKEKSGEFLAGGLFPLSAKGKPAPTELFAQFTGKSDLVYYDWELTGPRIDQWRPTIQLLPILRRNVPTRPVGPAAPVAVPQQPAGPKPGTIRENWLMAISPLLGNTVTEVSVSGKDELTLVRRSPIGLSAFELVLLSHWVTGSTGVQSAPAAPALRVVP